MNVRRSTYFTAVMTMGMIAISFLWLTSCRKEMELPEAYDKDGISLIVKEAKGFQTKVSETSAGGELMYKDVLFSDDSRGKICLEIIERDFRTGLSDTLQSATKASPYVGNQIGSFTVVSYVDGDKSPYFTKNLTYSNSAVSTGYYWPVTTEKTKMDFFGYAKSNGNGTFTVPVINPSAQSASFTYTLPDPTGDNTSAVEQPDLIFAISPDQTNTGTAVPMTFYHALSAIVFTSENAPDQFKVESVSFSGLASKASCSCSLNGSSLDFDWGTAEAKATFTQTFAAEVGGGGGKPVNTTEETFMMIPQTISNDATFKIVVSFGDRSYTIEKNLSAIISVWKPGKQYEFKISSPEEVRVDVSETFTEYSNKKENVFFTNTGLSTIKVRAAIIGYWVVKVVVDGVEQECVIADWNPDTDGAFSGLPGSGWTKGSDGYYYYASAIAPKVRTTNLFDSYTLGGTPPIVGAELVLTIVGQSVISGYEGSTWNSI